MAQGDRESPLLVAAVAFAIVVIVSLALGTVTGQPVDASLLIGVAVGVGFSATFYVVRRVAGDDSGG